MSKPTYGVSPQVRYIPTGITTAVLMQPVAGEASSAIKYYSGGSLLVMQAPVGTTSPGASLVAGYSNLLYYVAATSEAINWDGPCRYYLAAVGATVVVMEIRALSEGY